MMRQVVLLRGINVGRNRRVGMAELRAVLTDAGYYDVRTHLQSGNVLLTSDLRGEKLEPARVRELAQLAVAPERFEAVGRELFTWHPDGLRDSRLAKVLADRRLGVTATARNWNTVTKLLELADA